MEDQYRAANESNIGKEDEIDLISIFKMLWAERRTIMKVVILFIMIGLFVALLSEKEYTASTMMVPQIETQSANLGGLSSLASLAGFDMNMNSGTDAISPMLYPEIISSVNFQLEIMNAEYQVNEIDKPISLLDYYTSVYKPGLFGFIKKYTIDLPGLIMSAIRGDQTGLSDNSNSGIITLTRDQEDVREILDKNLSLVVNDQDGYLALYSRFNQANLSAQVARKAQKLLQEYVTKFKIEKAAAQLEFVKERYDENKTEFELAQAKLAEFRDANKNISSEIMRTHEEKLQYEYQLAFEVYSELAKQLEQSLIKVEEDTPVFSVIEEVVVPIDKSKPRRMIILALSIILGVLTGAVIILGRWIFSIDKPK